MNNRPFVTLKLATSLDGKIALASGESRWITGAAARAEVHALRARHDAILIGVGTALSDDPELTVRGGAAISRPPLRIVLDSQLRLPAASRLVATVHLAPLLVFCGVGAPTEREHALRSAGVDVRRIAGDAHGLDPRAALACLASEATSVFIEGGAQVAASCLSAGLVDRLEWFRAPIVLGGDAVSAVGALGLSQLGDSPRFRRTAFREVGPDIWETLEPNREAPGG